jgi:hypothetical protein
MNDKELLELAAKAAGIRLGGETKTGFVMEILKKPYVATWNPLTDDGDALRLAVKLGIDIVFAFGTCTCAAENTAGYAADSGIESVRLAIVQAAAEIGKSK